MRMGFAVSEACQSGSSATRRSRADTARHLPDRTIGRCPAEAIWLRSTYNHYLVSTMQQLLDRITLDPAVRSGKPVVRGTRIAVSDILEYLAGGMPDAEILEDFPDLDQDDIRAVLIFAAERERRLFSAS